MLRVPLQLLADFSFACLQVKIIFTKLCVISAFQLNVEVEYFEKQTNFPKSPVSVLCSF